MIIQSHIEQMVQNTPKGYNPKFNCWGATQYALGKRKTYGWVGIQVMETWLHKNTFKIDGEAQVGDILVIKSKKNFFLVHTAVYVGQGVWFHKCGKFETAYESQAEVIKRYENSFWGGDEPEIVVQRLNPPKAKKK